MHNILTTTARLLKRGFDFLKNREWALFIAFLATALVNAEAILEIVSGEIEKAGGKFDPMSLIIIAGGIVTRLRVWAPASVEKAREEDGDYIRVLEDDVDSLNFAVFQEQDYADKLQARVDELEERIANAADADEEAAWKALLADVESGAIEPYDQDDQ